MKTPTGVHRPALSLSQGMDYGRSLWRRFAKEPYLRLANALEKKRYPDLWLKQLSGEEANTMILQKILDRRPFLVGRMGHTEGRIVGEALFRGRRFGRLTKKQAHQNAGIFPVAPDLLSGFADIYAASIAQADLLGFWQTSFQARLLAEHYSQIPLAPLPALEPYLHLEPWSGALGGLRVLVVHPFASSIRSQFELNRHLLFANPQVLPLFELQVLSPPQTLAPMTGGYTTWIEALNHLIDRVLQHEFDVALLGCGAYGLPLGAAIKASGRQAIHLGGALQVLFGIRGRRWEEIPTIAAMMNEHWIRPSAQETPDSASLVDGGCYW
jgi:hypothetical protein